MYGVAKCLLIVSCIWANLTLAKRLTYKIVELLDNNEIMVGKDLYEEPPPKLEEKQPEVTFGDLSSCATCNPNRTHLSSSMIGY